MRSYYVSHTRKVFVYLFIFQELTYLLCVICSINQYLLSVCYFQEKSIPFKRFKVIPKNPMIYCDPRTWATYPAGSVSSSLKRRYYLTRELEMEPRMAPGQQRNGEMDPLGVKMGLHQIPLFRGIIFSFSQAKPRSILSLCPLI